MAIKEWKRNKNMKNLEKYQNIDFNHIGKSNVNALNTHLF